MQDLAALAARMTLPDETVRKQARAVLDELGGASGRVGDIAMWLAATQGHWPPRRAGQPVLIVLGDGAPPAPLVELTGARVVAAPVGDSGEGAAAALAGGAKLAAAEIDAGADLVLLAVGGDNIAATATTAVLANQEVATIVGHDPGMTDRDWMQVCAEVRDTARRTRPHAGRMIELLDALEDPVIATAAGVVTEVAARRTAVVLDDVGATAAALVAQRISYRTARWSCAAQASPHPAHAAALERLRLTPIVDYGLSAWSGHIGIGALLALGQLSGVAAVFEEAPPAG